MTDFNLANQPGASYRAEHNTINTALASMSRGATAPTTTFAGMPWVDSSGANDILKIRNAADSGWITVGTFVSGSFELEGSTAFTRGLLDDADAATARATLGLILASAAEYRSNAADRVLTADKVYDAAAEVSLTDGASIALDLNSGFNFTVTLGGNRTLANPTNADPGQSGMIRVVQDGTGSRTLSFGSNYEFAGGTAPTLSTGINDEDLLFYQVISSTRIFVSAALDIS